jgi:protein TonB
MNTLGLHPVYKPKDPARRFKGIAIVIALHIIIGYAIISGTARDALVALKKPLEAVVIQEVIIPPPPPPPPPPLKEIRPPDAPKIDAPPPPFVPPPDTPPPAASTAPAIVSTAAPPPAPVVIAPPPPPPPPIPQEQPKPTPNRADLRVACPIQVAPQMPQKAIDDGTEGIVKASALIKDGVIKEITILSGPRVFHAAVKAAMKQYKCTADTGEVVATQEFVFKLQ